MCGIIAIINKNNNQYGDIEPILEKISHRGVFQNEIYKFEKGVFGVNRLPIVDEKNGTQPLFNQDRSIFAVQNGEIFNYLELRASLVKKGYIFKSYSDTEVLVHLWKEYGKDMVKHLDTEMFAFIIYDKNTDQLFIARDRFGIKPLFYSETENHILFASEMKSLVFLDNIEEVKEFPVSSYYLNGKFTKYYDVLKNNNEYIGNSEEVLRLLELAVKKRVQTNLPIAVFLSGGVDSSLVMHFTTKHHKKVTALILGNEQSSDRKVAINLCEERGWDYKVISSEVNYEKELEGIIYHLENDNPNIVRHSFANNIISAFAKELGYKIVLTGEGADELFGGYNQFIDIDEDKINKACKLLLNSMSLGNLARVDRLAMRHTIEVRSPFFDNELVDYALSISGSSKKGIFENSLYTKYILRKAALKVLPKEISFRQKIPFGNGAGMDIGYNYNNKDGNLSKIARERNLTEQEMYTKIYNSFGYDKLKKKELVVKDNLTENI